MKALLTTLVVLSSLVLSVPSHAQLLPPLQPEQDACGALPLCGGFFSTPYSYNGYGFIKEQSQGNLASPYGNGNFDESNSVWFTLTVATSGYMAFVITPANGIDDYDFSVFNVTGKTCDSVTKNNRVRCNGYFNSTGTGIQTGLSLTGTGTTSGPGTGVPFLSVLNVNAGETYLVMVDNFGSLTTTGQSGFSIDFSSSTATYVGSNPPHFDTIAAACDYRNGLTVHLTKPVKCSSLQTNGSDFRLVPNNATVSAASGTNCGSGNGYTQTVTLNFSNPLPPGTYALKAKLGTDANTLLDLCNTPMPVDDSIRFTVTAPLNVNAGIDTVTCIHNSIQLNAVITGGALAGNTIVWSPAGSLSNPNIANPIATPTTNTTYTVTVTPIGFGASCAKTDQVKVDVLQGFTLANHDTTICKGAVVQMRAIGDPRYTYTWIPSTYLANPNAAITTATPDTTITYVIKASKVGCYDSLKNITITVEPVPTVNLGADVTICYGDTMKLFPDVQPTWYGNYTYSWSPSNQLDVSNIRNPIFTAHDSTILVLTVKTQVGCTGSDNKAINVIPNDFVVVSADTGICPGDTIRIKATGGISYTWTPKLWISDTSSATPLVYPITTTAYTVKARNAIGCRDTQTVVVTVYPRAVINLPDTVKIYPGESYQVDPGGNALYYTWFPQNGLSNPNIANPVAMPAVNTRYSVMATTEPGCAVMDTLVVMVVDESAIDVPNAFTPGSQPNAVLKPVHRGTVNLNSFMIYNRWGQKVFESHNIDEGWDGTLNGQPQPMGVYIYAVEATLPSGKRFVKQGNVTLLR